jgi:hypothetical protein
MRNHAVQGERVRLEFNNSNSGPLNVFDINGNVRTIAANERLIIDDIQADTLQANAITYLSTVSTGSPTDAEILYEWNTPNADNPIGQYSPEEGKDCPVGVTPFVTWAQSPNGNITLTGDGRIVAVTQFAKNLKGARQSWQANLTPSGNA